LIAGSKGCGKSTFNCHPERSEGSAFSQMPGEKQTPRATSALGTTKSAFFRSLFSRWSISGMVERPFWQYPLTVKQGIFN